MWPLLSLFAQQESVETVERSLEFARMPATPLEWIVLGAVTIGVAAFVIAMYRRDCVELSGPLCGFLAFLRLGAFAGLLLVYLSPQIRVEIKLRHDSVVAVASDVSLSMSIRDDETGSGTGPTRAEQVMAALSKGELVRELRKRHDVVLTTFGQEEKTVARLKRLDEGEEQQQQAATEEETKQIALEDIEWATELAPQAPETRMGQALRRILSEEGTGSLVGIVVFSDGQQNSGIETDSAIKLAQESKTKICTVGVGTDRMPVNARIGDFIAPARAYPGDDFEVTAYVQGQGLAGQVVTVELLSRPAESKDEGMATTEGTAQVTLGDQGQATAVPFKLTAEVPGRKTYMVRVQPVNGDINPRDDLQEADVEIIERKTRVLLFAGGPTREYRFLRNQLYRDPEVIVDVLLQTARTGVSQDADEILDEFPQSAAELADYDCIIAFDPDWLDLDQNQIEQLEKWVAEQSGGLVVVAGPVHTETWVGKEEMQPVRDMLPVKFSRHHALLDAGRFTNREPSPILLTRDGLEANFLWIEDSAVANRQAWEEFEGVYGYYGVREKKDGAYVYARYTDAHASTVDAQPIYYAGHFYGSGRVFYLGSGEMWRTRALNEAYFERFYTKLIRHVSEGRLLRGSKRGVLLVERDRYLIGQTVAVKAQLYNSELQPLDIASVVLDVIPPDNSPPLQITLKADAAGRKGMYNGQFLATQEGAYRLELDVPEASEEDRLTRRIQVKISDLERENPQLNEAKLRELAERTDGKYIYGPQQAAELLALLPARPTTQYRLDKPEPLWNTPWLLGLICGLLFVEWLTRRLAKLA